MKVIGFDPFLSVEAAEKIGVEPVDLPTLYKRADYITVHVPLSEKTKGLIGKSAFLQMKKGVYVINCARGGIVNESDLVTAIEEGIVAGAALDVFEQEPPSPNHPLFKLDQVICTPHLGAATDEAQENVALEVAEQVADFFTAGTIKNAVNFPSVSGEMLKLLKPYVLLGEKLGSLQGQMTIKLPTEVAIEYHGNMTDYNLAPVTQAVLKGLLAQMVSDISVNYVNASLIAKERGLRVIESKVREHEDFMSLLKVTVKNGAQER